MCRFWGSVMPVLLRNLWKTSWGVSECVAYPMILKLKGSIIGIMKGVTRSLDNGSSVSAPNAEPYLNP